MSATTKQDEKSPSPQLPLEQTSNEPKQGATGVSGPVGVAGVPSPAPAEDTQAKIDAAVKQALADQDAKIAQAVQLALTSQQAARDAEELRIADAVAKAVAALPTAQPATEPVNQRQKTTTIEFKEDGTEIQDDETIYLVKDKDRKYPMTKNALSGIICYQTRKGKFMGTTVQVPANDLSAIGIYTKDQYEQFSKPDGLFASQRIDVEVWHRPGDKNSVQK